MRDSMAQRGAGAWRRWHLSRRAHLHRCNQPCLPPGAAAVTGPGGRGLAGLWARRGHLFVEKLREVARRYDLVVRHGGAGERGAVACLGVLPALQKEREGLV
jgi:hypothetical protein